MRAVVEADHTEHHTNCNSKVCLCVNSFLAQVRFWLGAEKLANGSFQWNDGDLLPDTNQDGYPNWADGAPSDQPDHPYLMVSTDNELRPGFTQITRDELVTDVNDAYRNATTSIFFWVDATSADVAGLICERRG